MAPPSIVIDERATESTDAIIQKEVKKKWTSYIWDTFDKSPEERRLLFKLDTAILTFASLGEWQCYSQLEIEPLTFLQDTLSRIWIKSTSTMPLCLGCKQNLPDTSISTD
jgi:hypothetical protein